MKNKFSDKILLVNWEQTKKFLLIQWTEECGNLVKDDFEKRLDILKDIIKDTKPERVLLDLYSCEYFVEPENYRWYENTMFSMVNPGPKTKMAIVIPQNLFVHATFEATRISLEERKIPVQYFIDPEKATYWLTH